MSSSIAYNNVPIDSQYTYAQYSSSSIKFPNYKFPSQFDIIISYHVLDKLQ